MNIVTGIWLLSLMCMTLVKSSMVSQSFQMNKMFGLDYTGSSSVSQEYKDASLAEKER